MRHLRFWVYVVALAYLFVRLPNVGTPSSLDCSWQGLLQHDWNTRARAGVESVFTYGPLGFLVTAWMMFAVTGVWAKLVAVVLQALVLAAGLTWFARFLPSRRWQIGYLAMLPVLVPFSYGSELFLLITLLAIGNLRMLTAPAALAADGGTAPRLSPWLFVGLSLVVFALAGMTKFTYCVQAVVQVGALTVVLALLRRPAAAAGLAGAFVAVFAVTWVAIGQSLGDLGAYLRGSMEIATGYNEAMAQSGRPAELLMALALMAGNVALAVLLLRRGDLPMRRLFDRENLPMVASVAMAMAAMFLTWKAGFVRHDSSHTLVLFGFTAALPFVLMAVLPRAGAVRSASRGVELLAAALAVTALGTHLVCCEIVGAGTRAVRNAIVGARYVFHPVDFAARIESGVQGHAREFDLPECKARVGDEPMDIMGHEQGTLFAAGLHVRHRPVFQSYSAYTPYLQELNAAFFRGASAPRHVLAKVQSSDGRLALTEDSQAWLELLDHYYPVLNERGITLLERRDDAQPIARVPRIDRTVQLGEWVEFGDLGDDWLELALDVDFTLFGRALGFLYQPGQLLLDVRREDVTTFRIAPALVRAPFLLSPIVHSQPDLLAACLGQPFPRVRAVRVRAAPGAERHYADHCGFRLSSRRAPWPAATAAEVARLSDLHLQQRRLGLSLVPYSAEPFDNAGMFVDDKRIGATAHAPCVLLFEWPGGKHRLRAKFDLAPKAYGGDNHSDGVEFRVEIGRTAPRRVVFQRLLQPGSDPGDRGVQELAVELDLPKGETFALSTGVGPHGDGRWDWARWSDLVID